jgi:hypothetical protein
MENDKKTEGAWLIRHSQKLQAIAGAVEFQEIEFAGMCGILLSALASDNETTLKKRRVEPIAKSAGLNVHTDLPAILKTRTERQLIDQSEAGDVVVLGLTTPTVLTHTTDIFRATEPAQTEVAAVFLAEETSRAPAVYKDLRDHLSGTFELRIDQTDALLARSIEIGFVDAQKVDSGNQLLFNGNLFRVENAKKIESILLSLSSVDRANMNELEERLKTKGCVEETLARTLLGNVLFDKLHSIGVFDVSQVSNEAETTYYVTRPGAFGKFGNTIADDALDLAKALVSSLTYGMTRRSASLGRIRMLNALLDKLIRGETLNPSTAAGHDYKILELKGVVEVRPAGGGMFRMRLLKKEVGKHAKKILNFGDASEESLPILPGAAVTVYRGPEHTRGIKRKRLTESQVCLQLDASVVATMDSREAVKQFAELQGVILLDGHFLSRLKTKYAANNERFSDEEFHALIRSSKSDRLGVQWLDRLIFAKSRVLSDLDFNGCNSLLADVRYFAEQVRAVPHRREVALRSLYLAISLFLVALDFTMLDFAFEDKQAQLKRLIDGFRFGTAGASGAAKIFAVASNLVGAYADTKAPQREFAQMLKEQASELPVEIIAEFALKSSRALFDLARSFENFAYQRQFQPAQSLSPEHKAVIGAALDFFGMDRKAFFDVQTNESQDSRAISQISV